MTKVTWRDQTPDEQTGDDGIDPMKRRTNAIMPIAEDLAKALDGTLVAMYVDERREDLMRIIVAIDEDMSLAAVEVPMDATTIDDVPDEFEHYCSGLHLAEEILEDAQFSSPTGRKALVKALMGVDTKRAMLDLRRWMAIREKFDPKQG